MDYFELHHLLKERLEHGRDRVLIDDRTQVDDLTFRSQHGWLLPGKSGYVCPVHRMPLVEPDPDDSELGSAPGILDVQDFRIRENEEFHYQVMSPAGGARARSAILLLHGLNEKHWHKYLPWAHRLVALTGRSVILFPTAFHMNRAPAAWSDRHRMHRAANARRGRYPTLIGSSLSNAAMSTRIQSRPQRFFWSGLQTFHDVVDLLGEIDAGTHPCVEPGATIDLFGYSIGCLLAQVLLMTDPEGRLSDSRLVMFCGGAVFNRMSPVTRSILDSEANVALYSYVVEHLESHLRDSERLRHHLGEEHPEGMSFRAMLNYGVMRQQREDHFRRLSHRMLAIALAADTVIPPYEVVNALQGAARDIPTPVVVLDYPYPHSHEDPFPLLESLRAPVDAGFSSTLDLAAGFFNRTRG